MLKVENGVRPSKDQVAEELAQAHYEVDSGVELIVRLFAQHTDEGDAAEPVKLLEVNRLTVPVGVQPVYFGTHPASGMIYPSVVVEITPDEYRDSTIIEELKQRYGWKPGPVIRRK